MAKVMGGAGRSWGWRWQGGVEAVEGSSGWKWVERVKVAYPYGEFLKYRNGLTCGNVLIKTPLHSMDWFEGKITGNH